MVKFSFTFSYTLNTTLIRLPVTDFQNSFLIFLTSFIQFDIETE